MNRPTPSLQLCHLIASLVLSLLLMAGGASAAHAQPTLSKLFTPNTIGPGSVSTITFILTNASPTPVSDLAFVDNLPAAVTIADPASASTTCDLDVAGALTAPDSGGTITLSGGQLGGLQGCTITVDVTSSTPGVHTNPAVTLTSSAGSSMSLPIDLTVVTSLPGFSKSFSPSSVARGDRSTLTFTIDNSGNPSSVSNLDFIDNLPNGMVVAGPNNASTTCGTATLPATVTAVPGTDVIILDADGTLAFPAVAAGATCTVTVDVVTTGSGMLDNVSGELLANFVSSGKASATLEVTVTALALSKDFTDDPVAPGGTVTLELTVDNFDRNFSANDIAFTDDLTTVLAGLTFTSLLSNDCGGTVSGVGGTTLGLSGGSLPPEGSCTVRVSLSVPVGATPGTYPNTTSAVTGTIDGLPVIGNMASDDLFVEPVPIFTKEFIDDPSTGGGTVTLRFTLTNTDPASGLTGIEFTDDIGGTPPPDGRDGALPGLAANGLVAMSGLDPDPLVDPCGAGSELTIPDPNDTLPSPPFPNLPPDPTLLVFTGGSLAPAGMPGDTCFFDVTLDIPAGTPSGAYRNTTSALTATPLGAPPAIDDLIIVGAPSLSKEFIDDPVAPGGTVTLELTLSHPAEATGDATDISFTDDLNALGIAGLTVNLPPVPDPPCGAGSSLVAPGNVLTLQDGFLMPGEDCTFSVTLDLPAGAAPANYTNTTSDVSATVQGLAVTSMAASDDLIVSGLSFTKEFVGDPVIAGNTVTLRFTLANIHPTENATGISFDDDLAAVLPGTPDLTATLPPAMDTCGGAMSGPTSLSYAGGSVTAGATCVIELDVLVPAGTADGSYLNLTSPLDATQGGAVTVEPAADALTVQSNLLQLSKAFTDDPVAPGDNVTLELTLTNLDAGTPAVAIAFSDDLGAALFDLTFDSVLFDDCGGIVSGIGTDMITVSGASLAAGGSCTLRVSLSVPGGAVAGIYPNTTSALTGTIGGFDVFGDPASDDLVLFDLLQFSKSFDGPTTATGTAVLTFTLTNPGANNATDISFSDDLNAVIPGLIAIGLPAVPCGAGSSITGISFLTFSGGNLSPMGGTCSFDVDVLVPASATAGTFPNVTSFLLQAGLQVADPATANLVIEPPPTFAKVFAPDTVPAGGTSTLTFTIDNSASALPAANLDFTDNLPAGVTVANPPGAMTTCTGGTLTAVPGTGVISYTGGTVGAGIACTISVDVVAVLAGAQVNTTGDLTSSSGNSGQAMATLTVTPAPVPTFVKVFAPDSIGLGGVSTLTFTIDNTAALLDATGLDFTDNLPAGVIVASPSNAGTTCTGGTLTAMPGSGTILYSGGTVSAGTFCTVSVDVTATATGDLVNTTGDLTSSLGNSGPATDTLTVNPQPGFAKAFAPDPIGAGNASTLTFTIDNTGSTVDATGLDFTDNLPAGLVVASPSSAGTTCTGGTITAVSGTGTVSYTGGTAGAGASCTVTVDVTAASPGAYVNVSGELTSSLGSSGTATDTLDVLDGELGITKTFQSSPVLPGGFVDLEFTISNNSPDFTATSIAFTDDLDAALPGMVATGLPMNDVCGAGSVLSGTTVVSLAGGTLAPGASCTFSVTLQLPGGVGDSSFLNTTSTVTGDLSGVLVTGPPATDTFDVAFVDFSKEFSGEATAGNLVTLTFMLVNPDPVNGIDGLTFTDDLGAVLPGLAAVGLPASDVCGAGSVIDGTSLVTLTGGSLGPGETCIFSIDVQIPDAADSGFFTNVTSPVSGSVNGTPTTGGAGSEATAVLDVLGSLIAIPTLSTWGLAVLSALLGFLAVGRMSRRRR